MKRRIVIFFALLITVLSISAEQIIIRRDQSKLREGPGSFYPVVEILPKDSSVEIKKRINGWLLVDFLKKNGYISERATKPIEEKKSLFDKIANQKTDLRISRMSMTAGVKGFAGVYNKIIKGDPKVMDFIQNYRIDPSKYKKFKERTYKKVKIKKIRKNVAIFKKSDRSYYTFSETGLGLSIASKIASIGIVHNENVLNYVNYIGNLVVEASDAYDTEFKFMILNTPSINAYSCPGGYVFITKGLLEKIDSEAELAFILAHEIAHVAGKHGMKEAENRKDHLLADDMFMELDEELDTLGKKEISETEKEMENLTVSIYDTIFKGRLEKYEYEADMNGITYTIRAGYNQYEAVKILDRLAKSDFVPVNEHYTSKQIAIRAQKIKSQLAHFPQFKRQIVNSARFREILMKQ